MFESAETGYLHLLIRGYNNSVVSCDGISIDHFLLLFSSLSMRLLMFYLEHHCNVLWLIRLMNCLKMGWSLRPKRRAIWNIDGLVKKKKKLYFLHLIDILNDLLLICQVRTSWLHRSLFIKKSDHWIHRNLFCRFYKRKWISALSDQQFSLENPR